jgi:hypothetical protein
VSARQPCRFRVEAGTAGAYDRPVVVASSTRLALKEWDVVVAALEQGLQAILVRKGGLDDPGQRLSVPERPFWLYPTLFHERGVFLRPEFHELLVPGMHRAPRESARLVPRPPGHPRPVAPGHVAIRAVAEVVEAVAAPSLASLRRLLGRTVWTEKYVTLRYRWRPQDRPLVLVLRVAALPEAVDVEERREYAGCRSWLELIDPPDTRTASPVWPPGRLADEVAAVRSALSEP